MWLFKHGKISILFTVMIFVIRYFGETQRDTWKNIQSTTAGCFERPRKEIRIKTKTEKTDGTFPDVLSQQQPLSETVERRGKALEFY